MVYLSHFLVCVTLALSFLLSFNVRFLHYSNLSGLPWLFACYATRLLSASSSSSPLPDHSLLPVVFYAFCVYIALHNIRRGERLYAEWVPQLVKMWCLSLAVLLFVVFGDGIVSSSSSSSAPTNIIDYNYNWYQLLRLAFDSPRHLSIILVPVLLAVGLRVLYHNCHHSVRRVRAVYGAVAAVKVLLVWVLVKTLSEKGRGAYNMYDRVLSEHGSNDLVNLTLVLLSIAIAADDASTAEVVRASIAADEDLHRGSYDANSHALTDVSTISATPVAAPSTNAGTVAHEQTQNYEEHDRPIPWHCFCTTMQTSLRRVSDRFSFWKSSYYSDSDSTDSESGEQCSRGRSSVRYVRSALP